MVVAVAAAANVVVAAAAVDPDLICMWQVLGHQLLSASCHWPWTLRRSRLRLSLRSHWFLRTLRELVPNSAASYLWHQRPVFF